MGQKAAKGTQLTKKNESRPIVEWQVQFMGFLRTTDAHIKLDFNGDAN